MDPPWSASPAADTGQGPQRRIGRSLQALVPTIQAESRVTPDLLPHSRLVAGVQVHQLSTGLRDHIDDGLVLSISILRNLKSGLISEDRYGPWWGL